MCKVDLLVALVQGRLCLLTHLLLNVDHVFIHLLVVLGMVDDDVPPADWVRKAGAKLGMFEYLTIVFFLLLYTLCL